MVWSWAATSSRLLGRLKNVNSSRREEESKPHYFSTHGCRREASFGGALEEPFAFAAAAAARALLLKKFDMAAVDRGQGEYACDMKTVEWDSNIGDYPLNRTGVSTHS